VLATLRAKHALPSGSLPPAIFLTDIQSDDIRIDIDDGVTAVDRQAVEIHPLDVASCPADRPGAVRNRTVDEIAALSTFLTPNENIMNAVPDERKLTG
jgi:hypothetical protein